MSLFDTHHGWLRYAPHSHFKLPRIVPVTAPDPSGSGDNRFDVPLCDKHGAVRGTRTLHRLVWPGQLPFGHSPKADSWDTIPAVFLERLGLCQCGRGNVGAGTRCTTCLLENPDDAPSATHHDLTKALRNGWTPPDELPMLVAYHMAVNTDHYLDKGESFRHPVGGLPPERVRQVMDARFALDAKALGTLSHLAWTAEAQHANPHLDDDVMSGPTWEGFTRLYQLATQTWFCLLGDHIYEFRTKSWLKESWKHHWWQMAGYMFWLGRKKPYFAATLAGMKRPVIRATRDFDSTCSDAVKGLTDWADSGFGVRLSHVKGDDPAGADLMRKFIDGGTFGTPDEDDGPS